MSEKNKKLILDFAMKELEKVLKDLKDGKVPTLSKDLLKLKETISNATQKISSESNLSQEEEDKLANDMVKDLDIEKK
jgi:hypothetical protein